MNPLVDNSARCNDDWDEPSVRYKTIRKSISLKDNNKRFRIQGFRNKYISAYKIINEIEYQIQEFRKNWFLGIKKWMPFIASSYARYNDIVYFNNLEEAKVYLNKLNEYYGITSQDNTEE